MSGGGKGIHTGRAPFGYRYRRNESDVRVLLIDEEKAAWVRLIFAHFLAGRSYPDIADGWKPKGRSTATGLSLWNPITPRQIVINPVYTGLIRDGGELVEGNRTRRSSTARPGKEHWHCRRQRHEPTNGEGQVLGSICSERAF